MGKHEVLNGIRKHKEVFGDVASQMRKVNGSLELTDQGKASRIADIESKNDARVKASRDALLTAIDELKGELMATRKSQVAEGLADLDRIAFVVNGIQNNAYDTTMVADLMDTFSGNPVALANIRTALASSNNHDYNTMALDMPKGNDANRVINNLDRMANTLKEERPIASMLNNTDDIMSSLYVNGSTFDSWDTYITDNIAD